MNEDHHEQDEPSRETLPEGAPPQGEASLKKGHVEWEPHGGKGGDHPTPGAGEHDKPNG